MSAVLLLSLCASTWGELAYWRDGASIFHRALEVTDRNAFAEFNYADALAKSGDADGAIAHFRRALLIKPDVAAAHDNLGQLLLARGDQGDALFHMRKAVELDSKSAEAHNALGSGLVAAGDTMGATREFERAISLNPALPAAHLNLAVLLLRSGDRAQAKVQLFQAADYLGDQSVLLGVGRVLAAVDPNDAVAFYRRMLAAAPDWAQAHVELGMVLERMRRNDESAAEYRLALRLRPDDPDARAGLTRLARP